MRLLALLLAAVVDAQIGVQCVSTYFLPRGSGVRFGSNARQAETDDPLSQNT